MTTEAMAPLRNMCRMKCRRGGIGSIMTSGSGSGPVFRLLYGNYTLRIGLGTVITSDGVALNLM